MINLTIDGKAVQVQEGMTVLQAAEAAGIHIPTLCNHPALKPFGGCRLCLVEVEGMRTLQPSCTMPAGEKMVISTDTEKVKAARRFVLNMIFSDRNHFCPYCQVSGGDCELQNAALDEAMNHWSFPPNWDRYPVDATHPYFVMDHNRCILCQRCVRACGQLVGNFTLGIEARGARSMLVADTGIPLGESTCVQCGTCVSVCPTGALIERDSAYQGHVTQLSSTRTVCTGCSVGCGVEVFTRDNRMVRILGDWEAPINGGVLCKQGRFMPLEEKRERITTPLVRKNGKLQPASWDEALQAIAEQVKPLAGKNGAGIAAVASTGLPVEALSIFKQVFATCLGSEMVTSTEEGSATRASSTLAAALGKPFEGALEALKAADGIMAVQSGLNDEHQVAGFFIKRNLPNGAGLVMVEPQLNDMAIRANAFLKAGVGQSAAVINGISAALVRLGVKMGDAVQAAAMLAEASAETGISENDLLAAAGILGSKSRLAFVYGAALPLEALRALASLAQKTGAALIGLKGAANSLAAAQLRLDRAFKLNGHRVAYAALGDESPSEALVDTLTKAPFLAVQASHVSELTAQADVVLPVTTWAEQEGTYVNLEGRAQKAVASLAAPQGVRSNAQALAGLAEKLGFQPAEDWQHELNQRPAPVKMAV